MRRVLLVCLALVATPAAAFDYRDVVRMAEKRSEQSYQAPDTRLPPELAGMGYDRYRDIRFKPDKSLWRGSRLPFELQFLHVGGRYDQPVKVNLVSADGVMPIAFKPDHFDYGRNDIDPAAIADLGFSGFRVHYPVNREDYKDEVLVFQGASYFRALGRGQRYGLSARGLGIDTGELSGEEFPRFTEFWIEWPRAEDRALVILALLDSPRVTGAYRFQLKPGDATTMDVKARLFFRNGVPKLGVAPLTSMFLFGENQPGQAEDYRPEVHDSDGLSVHTDQEWIWRPLINPRRLLITSFGTSNPRGFGLMQRDRDFASYQDLGARYELRPSLWVEPLGDWGKGRVELVTIPTPDETNDNIVAYWVPERAPRKGDRLDLEYRLHWQMNPETRPPLMHVVQTRRGHGWLKEPDNALRFHIDFAGGELPEDAKPVAGIWVSEAGELLERQVYRNPVIDGWRVSLRVRRNDETRPLEMRVMLRHDEQQLSETWAYVLPATAGR